MDIGANNFQFMLDAPEKPAQTYRYPKTAELHLDSLDRYNENDLPGIVGVNTVTTNPNFLKLFGPIIGSASDNATNNCLIQTKRNLIYGYMSRVALTQFNLNYRVPTVVAGVNDQFAVTTGGANPITAAIPQGYYNITTLAAAFQTALRTITGLSTATVTAPTSQSTTSPFASPITTGFSITSPIPMAFVYGFTNANENAQVRVARANRLLGINRAGAGYTPDVNATAVPSPFNTSIALYTSVTLGIPNFLQTDYVDIVSQALTNYKDTKDANSSISSPGSVIGRIWLTEYPLSGQATNNSGWPQNGMWGMSPMSFVKTWQNPNWSQWSPNQAINTVDITLLDMWGRPLFWSSTFNTEWSATVTVTE
jgi:hypothetical protein